MDATKDGRERTIVAIVVLLVAAYILFPVGFYLPFYYLRKAGVSDSVIHGVTGVIFYPLLKLDSICPPYSRLLRIEGDWAEKYFPPEVSYDP